VLHKFYTREATVAKLQAPLLAQRQRRREYFQRLTPKITSAQTRSLVEHELALLWTIEDSPRGSVPMWGTLTDLARAFTRSGYVQTVHPERQRFLAVLQRLIREKKIYRFRYRRRKIRVNDILLTESGQQHLYFLRGLAPPERWATKPRPREGPTLGDFLAAPQYFKFPDKWPALPAGEAEAIMKVDTTDLVPRPNAPQQNCTYRTWL
jgi:hypothetical protein